MGAAIGLRDDFDAVGLRRMARATRSANHRLRFIANARDLGFPIEDIRELLGLWSNSQRASAEVKALAIARADELGRKAEALQALRRTLLDLAARCHGDSRPDCPIIERMSGEVGSPAGKQ